MTEGESIIKMSPRPRTTGYRLAHSACLTLSALCLAWAFMQAPHASRGLSAETTSVSFGSAPAGIQKAVWFDLKNDDSEAHRVVGATSACFRLGCVRVEGLPLLVPPHDSRRIRVEVTTRGQGDFYANTDLFTDCPRRPQIRLEVTGLVVPD